MSLLSNQKDVNLLLARNSFPLSQYTVQTLFTCLIKVLMHFITLSLVTNRAPLCTHIIPRRIMCLVFSIYFTLYAVNNYTQRSMHKLYKIIFLFVSSCCFLSPFLISMAVILWKWKRPQ